MDINQPFQVTQQEAPPPVSARQPNMPLMVIGAILLLGTGLLGGYMLRGNTQSPPQEDEQMAKVSPTVKPTTPSPTAQATPQYNDPEPAIDQTPGADARNIKYALPSGWKVSPSDEALSISSPDGEGTISIGVFNYPGMTGRREYFCQVTNLCVEGKTQFTPTTIGNISGYIASPVDNSGGGGTAYFGSKGNKMYVINIYNYSSTTPNEFTQHYKELINSLVF